MNLGFKCQTEAKRNIVFPISLNIVFEWSNNNANNNNNDNNNDDNNNDNNHPRYSRESALIVN